MRTLEPARRPRCRASGLARAAGLALIACELGGCAAVEAPAVVRLEGPGEPRVDVRLAGDPLAAIDALAVASDRLILVERAGPAPPRAAAVDLDGAPWGRALAVLAKAGGCRLERLAVDGRRAVRVVQEDAGPLAAGFLRPGMAAPGEGPAGERLLRRRELEPDLPGVSPPRGELRARYVAHDADTVGVLLPAPRGRRRLEVLRIVGQGAARRALLRELERAQEGDLILLSLTRFKGRWQVEALLGAR